LAFEVAEPDAVLGVGDVEVEDGPGAMLSLSYRDEAMNHPDLRPKLNAIGFGFFIPCAASAAASASTSTRSSPTPRR
jgi:hypothetical protein